MEKNLAIALTSIQALAPSLPSSSSDGTVIPDQTPDLRLVIEEDAASGLFVYKTIDRRTGEMVQQYPREEVVRMHARPEYKAGAIIKTRA